MATSDHASMSLAPAIVCTVYDDPGLKKSRPILEELMVHAAPGDLAVCLHTIPDSTDAPSVQAIKDLGLRFWWGFPYDPIAKTMRKRGGAAARQQASTWARAVAVYDPEVVCLNGESAWKPDADADTAALGSLALDCIKATREDGHCKVSWTSFDHPLYHHLPWGAILGLGGVDYHAPQVYAAPKEGVGDWRDARNRIKSASNQWEKFAEDHAAVQADLLPSGANCHFYFQAHNVSAGGVAMVADQTDTSRAWAIPTRVDAEGIRGLKALLICRKEAGRAAGAIKRWQGMHGLEVDGILGESQSFPVLGL